MAVATVATSHYAASIEDIKDKEEVKSRAKTKLAANSRYVILSERVICSEKGEEPTDIALA
jgi:hypothetical protein